MKRRGGRTGRKRAKELLSVPSMKQFHDGSFGSFSEVEKLKEGLEVLFKLEILLGWPFLDPRFTV